MPDLSYLDQLVEIWQQFAANNPDPDQFSRNAGYVAGLTLCARQLAEELERIKADV